MPEAEVVARVPGEVEETPGKSPGEKKARVEEVETPPDESRDVESAEEGTSKEEED